MYAVSIHSSLKPNKQEIIFFSFCLYFFIPSEDKRQLCQIFLSCKKNDKEWPDVRTCWNVSNNRRTNARKVKMVSWRDISECTARKVDLRTKWSH